MAVPNSTYDQVTAITNKFYMPKFPEAVFTSNPVFQKMWKNGEKASSGTTIHVPIIYAKGTGGAFNPKAQLDIAAKDQVTAADFNWKHYYAAISVFDDEVLRNDGPEGIRKLIDAKMKTARLQIADDIATDMWKTTSAYYGDSATQVNSIVGACGNAAYPDTTITYGGIVKSAANSFWHGVIDNQAGVLAYADMENMRLTVSQYGTTPDMIVCCAGQIENFFTLGSTYQRYWKQDTMDTGFPAYSFAGIPLIMDSRVSTTEMYFLTTDFLDIVSHKKQNMRLEPFQKPVDQAAAVAKIFWMGNVVCSDCRRQGLMYAITA